MATSLAAIGIIATIGAITYSLHGEVQPGPAMLVGLPGAVGRARRHAGSSSGWAAATLSLAFAVLLAGIGFRLLVF